MLWDSIKKQLFNKKVIIFAGCISIALLSFGTYRVVATFYTASQPLIKPPPEVKGSIVTLRALREEYYIPYHTMFSNTARKGLEFPAYITLGYTIKYLQWLQQTVDAGETLQYCIFDNKDNKLIGMIDIRNKNDIDPGQFGVWINEAYWGGGRTREAIKLITDVYFRLKPHEKSYIAHVRLWNKRSYYALKKAGFVDVGYFYEEGKATRYILEMKRT